MANPDVSQLNIDGITSSDAKGLKLRDERTKAPTQASALEDAVDELIEFCYEDSQLACDALPDGLGMRGPNTSMCDKLRRRVLDLLEKRSEPIVPAPVTDNGLLTTHDPTSRICHAQ